MKKYLREIEVAGVILAIIGIISSLVWGAIYGGWLCGIGILLLLVIFLYKAFHWKEYERENKQYIMIILLTIAILLFQMLTKR
jgi:polyferredoxin